VCFPVNATRELSYLSLPIHTSANGAQAGGRVDFDCYALYSDVQLRLGTPLNQWRILLSG
jgi:hypothetical protein